MEDKSVRPTRKILCSNNLVTLRESLASAISRLTAANIPSPRMNAELLLMFTLECDRAYLHAHPERKLSADEHARYDHALTERERGVPAQYITGHQEFWGMDLIVTPAVLIPRPETEHVIETVLDSCGAGALARRFFAHRRCRHRFRLHCLGPGQRIARRRNPRYRYFARRSRNRTCQRGSTSNLKAGFISIKPTCCKGLNQGFDFVVSNPPYVGESEEDQVQLEVRKYEPHNAVFAGLPASK